MATTQTPLEAETTPTTPEQLAKLWVKLTRAKKDIALELEAIETALRGHVNETGEVRIGVVTAFRKMKPANLALINDKYEIGRQKEALLAELEGTDYVKMSLDVTGIHKAAPYEKIVERALTKCKLATIQEEEWYFKAP
jgi:hypothetical protein